MRRVQASHLSSMSGADPGPPAAGRRLGARLPARKIGVATLSTIAILAAGVSNVPAAATIGAAGIAEGKNITVFHNIDFVATFGWDVGDIVTVEVVRNGVVIGSETGPAAVTPEGGALEVNHGPEGTPGDGDCFEGSTPDIRPGDLVRVTGAGTTSEAIVDDITFSGPATEDLLTGDILVRGVAKRANGTPIPVDFLDSAEFRDGKFRGAPDRVEADPLNPDGGFVMIYEKPYNLVDGRNDDNLDENERKKSLLTSGGHATGFGHVAVLPPEAMLVDGLDDTPGPAPGCEASVAGGDAVTDFSDDILNLSEVASPGDLKISGATSDASQVTVTVGSLSAVSATVTRSASGSQTWTASVPMSDVAQLADGTVPVAMSVTRTGGGTATGVPKSLVKDTVAPPAPTSPNSQTFVGSTNVILSGEQGDVLRYTVGDGSQPAPTASTGSAYAGPVALSQSATLKAIAIDAAGNESNVLTRSFTRTVPQTQSAPPAQSAPPRPPAPPASPTAPAQSTGGGGSSTVVPLAPSITRALSGRPRGKRTATVKWSTPRANGALVQGYEVRALRMRASRSAKVRPAVAVGSDARRLTLSLPAGKYRFQVRAISAAGEGPWSSTSRKVRAR